MTDRELLEAVHNDIQIMRTDLQAMKDDIQAMKEDSEAVRSQAALLDVKLEKEVNHSIQLLTENHMHLVDKLSQAIKVQDKASIYEVQVTGLKITIERLEKEIAALKAKSE